MKNKQRKKEHRRIDELEQILSFLNDKLGIVEKEITREQKEPGLPVLFIVGNPRSGTTLLFEFLSQTNLFAYPSNIISRFYNAPYIGSLVHKVFVDLDKKNELFNEDQYKTEMYTSNLGKTKGASAPNEFWYFWRKYFQFQEIQRLESAELDLVQVQPFLKELSAFEEVFKKPILMKAMILNWNLDFLMRNIPRSIFLFVKRDALYNMFSLYKSRIEFFGDASQWYSFKPPEYHFLKDLDIYEQLAGQVIYTNHTISEFLKTIPQNNSITIEYEKFCQKPGKILDQILEKLWNMKYKTDYQYAEGTKFSSTNQISDKTFDRNKAVNAIISITNRNNI